MRIAICEDDTADAQTVAIQVRAYCNEKKLNIQVDYFSCGEDFLATSHGYEIVFMDIYLTGMSGMEAARKYGESSCGQIVFTTTSWEHAVEAFGLNVAHYLVKPLTQAAIDESLDRCITRMQRKPFKFLEVKSSQGVVPIPMENITYIEVFDKISTIHTRKNNIQTYTSLDGLFELLDEHYFLKAQRSFIVNMNYIESFFFDRVILQGGVEIVLSRNNRMELKNQYQRFLFNMARRGEV